MIREYEIYRDEDGVPYLHTARKFTDRYCLSPAEFCKYELNMDKLDIEYSYVIGLDDNEYVQCIYNVSRGTYNECSACKNKREIAIILLLSGSKKFIFVHNHPGSEKLYPSDADYSVYADFIIFGNQIGIEQAGNIIIGIDEWYDCMTKEHYDWRKK